jgi:hypothetical protein
MRTFQGFFEDEGKEERRDCWPILRCGRGSKLGDC